MVKVIFLVSQRYEIVQLAESLFHELSNKGICMLPVITLAELPRSGKISAECLLDKSNINFRPFTDFYKKTALKVLEEEKPSLIITDNDLMNVDNAFVVSGRNLNIPTLVIRETTGKLPTKLNPIWVFSEVVKKLNQLPRLLRKYSFYVRSMAGVKPALLLNAPNLVKVLLAGHESGIVGKYADYILANAPEDGDSMREQCPQARFVRAVGHPRFDKTFNLARKQGTLIRREIQQTFKIPKNKKIILFLSSAQIEHGVLTLEQKILAQHQILSTFEKFKDKAHIIIKLHPIEKNIFPLTWKPEYDSFIHVTNSDLSKLIVASDVIVTWFSTAMIDVVLARKPLIVINFHNERETSIILPSTLVIVDNGAALEATNEDQLLNFISTLLKDERSTEKLGQSQEIFNSTYLKTIDGKSMNRIVEAIREIITLKS